LCGDLNLVEGLLQGKKAAAMAAFFMQEAKAEALEANPRCCYLP
jgi:hypothetical protein